MRYATTRSILAELFLVAAGLAPSASAQLGEIRLEEVATGLVTPVAATHAGDERLFVTLLGGQVRILEDGIPLPGAFLDLGDRIQGGLFSIAFHPDYTENGFFFAHYAEGPSGDSLVSRFEVSSVDPNRSVKSSEKVLLRIPKAERLHYGGQLAFGPDGYLYVSTGDGTGQGRVDPSCAAQSLGSLEGKILRLDVDRNVDREPYYGVPPGNPFAGQESSRGEIWAYGLRNPWRFSFDRVTGDIWLTDVGQDRREEIDFEPAASAGGRNYGWKVMEGGFCFNHRAGCPASLPPCDDASFTPPVFQYPHSGGRCSVIGGYVYRGGRIPELEGRYLYGDLCTGEVWAARYDGTTWQAQALPFTVPDLNSFGEDASGEIWMTGRGTLYRLAGAEAPEPVEPCVADESHLCLNQGRFEVSVSWRTSEGLTGLGRAVSLGADAGMFWFFGPDNPELFVKVLDGCFEPFNHYWVFAAGLTEVETSLTVVDTRTGDVRRYDSALGQPYFPVRDTRAFASCP